MKRLLSLILSILLLTGCASSSDELEYVKPEINSTYYQIFVGSFSDSDGDGIGDLNGIREKLDYIQYDLGANAIWLTPIHPSPTYHKYDVVDYYGVDEDFGTMEDFDALVDEMNERGMDLILDLVLNHTSSRHPWFLKAVSAQLNGTCDQTPECDFYNFSTTPQTGFARAGNDLYFEAVFWEGMPDLNLANETVRSEIQDIVGFWMDKGIKGFRLDATTHFFAENLEKNVEFLTWFNDIVKQERSDAYLVGEAWTSGSIVNRMFASGVDSFFNFDFSQQSGDIVKSIQRGQGNALANLVVNHTDTIQSFNEGALDAVFLSNHDNNRSAGYLSVNENYQRMAASTYLLMPGNVFIYYGEEIGMKGSGIDENKRLPMVWSTSDDAFIPNPPPNATQTNTLEKGVKEQLEDKTSLLMHYQRVVCVRNMYPQISRASVKVVDLGEESIYATQMDEIIVIHNFSDDSQTVKINGIEKVTLVDGTQSHSQNELTLGGWSSVVVTITQ
ncbi:hypothetical protein AOC36_01570 [Erysipelothrix larvae]|uniref:Alpha-amylase n=1 Tax=Erysipelothrix larvae TaxID=1514105 RepID=A0A0X8GYF2_9FIRM|nr:alpha-amylase family glycosyl hydrolase [Erysipelothrix larvae]AMC92720.1 hypothetical protein AOC36_01570 [Erysipelothrix larvae]